MSNLSVKNSQDLRFASKHILNLPEIRMIVLIGSIDCFTADDYHKGITPIAKIDQYKTCMKRALELFMKKDLVEYGEKQN